MKTLPKKHSFHSKLWLSVALAASSTAIVATSATGAEAATFTVDYAGTIDSIFTFRPSLNPGASPEEWEKQKKTIFPTDQRFEGSYTFDDATNEVLSARYDVEPNFDIGFSLTRFIETDTFTPFNSPPTPTGQYPNYPITTTSSTANQSSAEYSTSVEPGYGRDTERISVNRDGFTYDIQVSAAGIGSGQILGKGSIERFVVTEVTETTPSDSTSIPEPATVIGLLVMGGLGLAGTKRGPSFTKNSHLSA